MNQVYDSLGGPNAQTFGTTNVSSQTTGIDAVTNDLLMVAKVLSAIQERVAIANSRVSGPRPREVPAASPPNVPPTLSSIAGMLLNAAHEIDGELRRLVG